MRNTAKFSETEIYKTLNKNGKNFVAPVKKGDDLKELFQQLASVGAGRPLDENGFPQGSWTPDLLAEAITNIPENKSGVDLRTVQLWFQDNDKGISADNIRWLARIFGCGCPDATSAWQAELCGANGRLTAKRRAKRNRAADVVDPAVLQPARPVETAASPSPTVRKRKRFNLARGSEAILSHGSPLDLPALVFAGAVALGFLSYLVGIHSATHVRDDGIVKQVGFLWAPNWTFLFTVFMPLFFAFAGELIVYWKSEARPSLTSQLTAPLPCQSWSRCVKSSQYTYWAAFVLCLAFAGALLWIRVRLMPLLGSDVAYAIDWGTLTLITPDVIAIPTTIAFTGLAYLYMSLCFYLFFAGLILLYTLTLDLWKIDTAIRRTSGDAIVKRSDAINLRVLRGIFRATVCGLLIASCMKLQCFYLATDSTNVWTWLLNDARIAFARGGGVINPDNYSMPTYHTSLLIAISTVVVYAYGAARLGRGSNFSDQVGSMTIIIMFVSISYVLIGAFPGFSFIFAAGVTLGIFGLFDPSIRMWPKRHLAESKDVT